jgi:hypothetical protein
LFLGIVLVTKDLQLNLCFTLPYHQLIQGCWFRRQLLPGGNDGSLGRLQTPGQSGACLLGSPESLIGHLPNSFLYNKSLVSSMPSVFLFSKSLIGNLPSSSFFSKHLLGYLQFGSQGYTNKKNKDSRRTRSIKQWKDDILPSQSTSASFRLSRYQSTHWVECLASFYEQAVKPTLTKGGAAEAATLEDVTSTFISCCSSAFDGSSA